MEATQGNNRAGGERVAGFVRILAYGAAAGAAAAALNALVYLVAFLPGAVPQSVVGNGQSVR